MSENEKKVAEVSTAKAETKKQKKNRVTFRERIAKGWRDYKSEMKKIVWFNREQTFKSSVIVIVSILICAICVGALDIAFSRLLELLASLV
ncbi:MAG: preprotein translocase subunit SecE [Clostridia bacterium]|nr:preprotein translocase subunit SecE [Clostridia bacterium]